MRMSRCSGGFAEGSIQIHDKDPPGSGCMNTLHVCVHFLPVCMQRWDSKHTKILCELYSLSQRQPANSVLSLAFQPIIKSAVTLRDRGRWGYSRMTHDNQSLDVRQAHGPLFSPPKPFGFHIEVRPARIRISGDGKNVWGIGIKLPIISIKA